MILNISPITQEIVTLYFEIHGEYTGALRDLQTYSVSSDYIHVSTLFDFDNLTDVSDMWDALRDNGDVSDTERPDLVQETFDNLFPGLRKALDIDTTDFGRVWMLSGSRAGHQRAFRALADALDQRPSGDDDTFDYWPNAMRMLHAMATDLGELGKSSIWLDRYEKIREDNAPEEWAAEMSLP